MIIGVDIGGTKTLVASFVKGEIVREDRFATTKDSEVFMDDLIPLLKLHAHKQRLEAISIAAPGIIDHYRGSIVRCGNLPWKDIAIRTILREHFSCPIYLENDANLAGLAEAHALHPVPRLCLYVTVSTGIGTGIIVNGKILPALSGSEAGHITLKRGKEYGLWEHLASGRSLFERTGKMAYEQRDTKVWADVAERVAAGLFALIPTLQPSAVIIGGSLGGYLDIRWREPLEKLLNKHTSPYITVPPIIQAEHPKEAVLYGCKIYAKQRLEDD